MFVFCVDWGFALSDYKPTVTYGPWTFNQGGASGDAAERALKISMIFNCLHGHVPYLMVMAYSLAIGILS